MLIRIIATGQEGEHNRLFPNTAFAYGDIDITPEWLIKNGCEIVVIPPYIPTEEELLQQQREQFKLNRTIAVSNITVTVNGKVFDGDETSQTRMARAIIGLQAASVNTINWTLADNTNVQVTLQELTEALILSGQRQAELWVMQ